MFDDAGWETDTTAVGAAAADVDAKAAGAPANTPAISALAAIAGMMSFRERFMAILSYGPNSALYYLLKQVRGVAGKSQLPKTVITQIDERGAFVASALQHPTRPIAWAAFNPRLG
jgi:hypothetical protein